jgi:hypothetical protein
MNGTGKKKADNKAKVVIRTYTKVLVESWNDLYEIQQLLEGIDADGDHLEPRFESESSAKYGVILVYMDFLIEGASGIRALHDYAEAVEAQCWDFELIDDD